MNKTRLHTLFFIALTVASAQAAVTVLVPYDSTRPYQQNPNSHVQKVVHYEYSLGGHSQVNSRESLTRLAQKYGFRLERWTEQADVTVENLAGVDVVVFNNGDGDVLRPINSPYVAAMKNFVEAQGKALLTLHDAAAFVPCPTAGAENLDDPNCTWLARVMVRQYFHQENDPTRARIYADSVVIGQIVPNATGMDMTAATLNHGRRNPETRMIFEDLPPNGATANPNQHYVWDGVGDEWKTWRGYVRQQGAQVFDGIPFGPVVVLLSLDETSYTSTMSKMGDRSVSWTRKVGNGLGAHNSMGHSNIWTRNRTGNGLGSTVVNDSFPEKYNWRLIRYLARDFVGCMNPGYAEYNLQASVTTLTASDDPSPCKTAVTLRPGRTPARTDISVRAGVIRLKAVEQGTRLIVTDVSGKRMVERTETGAGIIEITGLKPGIYFVRITNPDGSKSARRVNLF